MAAAVEVLSGFGYHDLDSETRIFVQQRTSEIRGLLRHRAQNAIEIGVRLMEVKDRLGYGSYRDWVETEFAWGKSSANQFENVAKQFADVQNLDNFDLSALYLLAAPSTSEEVRETAIAEASEGKRVTHARAKELTGTKEADSGFQPGQRMTVVGETATGQEVEIVEAQGKKPIVYARLESGETMPFLKSELSAVDNRPIPSPQPEAPKPKPEPKINPLEGCEVRLQVAEERIALLEQALKPMTEVLEKILDSYWEEIGSTLVSEAEAVLSSAEGLLG